jgi:endonuclease G
MRKLVVAAIIAVVATGCAQPPSAGDDELGQARVELAAVPADVRCVRVVAEGARVVSRAFDATPGQPAELLLDGLPVGAVRFSGEAFSEACVGVGPGAIPGWLAEPVVASISAQEIAPVALVMRRNGRVRIATSFDPEDDPPAVLPPGDNLGASPHVLLGIPLDVDPADDYLLDRTYWVGSYNDRLRIANWVAWRIVPADLGSVSRRDDFRADLLLPAPFFRVGNRDYTGSGYDRGHLCPSGDRTASIEANSATFLMTNMHPQLPALNRGVWSTFEEFTRTFVRQGRHVQAVTGGIFSPEMERTTIGPLIAVPHAAYKIIVVLEAGQGLAQVTAATPVYAVIMPNASVVVGAMWRQYLVSVDEVERQSGYDFLRNVPDEIEEALERRVASAP